MPEKFQDILRRVREQKQMSQSDLANKAGLQPAAISHFENGRRAPSIQLMARRVTRADGANFSADPTMPVRVRAVSVAATAELTEVRAILRGLGFGPGPDPEVRCRAGARPRSPTPAPC